MIKTSIIGLQKAQAANIQMLAAMQVDGALGRAVQWATAASLRSSVARSPADTGSWRGSHRADMEGLQGRVFIQPGARNRKSGTPVEVYASIWDARGGKYAVYARVVEDAGPRIMQQAVRMLNSELPS